MAQDKQIGQHRVAVTVILDAEGMDPRDAQNVAELAVAEALDAMGGRDVLTTHTHTVVGTARHARVIDVMSMAAAFSTGALTIHPSPTARH